MLRPENYMMENQSVMDLNSTVGCAAPWGPWKTALLVMLSCCSFVTTIGNVLVIIAFIRERKLRTNFNLFLLNLAITDLLVSLTAIPFYTIKYAMCQWPFDQVSCGLWIFMDWGMTFASIFTLVAISVDRYWATCWSIHYRAHNSRRRTLIVIAIIWVVLVVVWVPPFIKDRLLWSAPGECIWSIDKNRLFSVIVALLGYHGPSVVIFGLYIKVVVSMSKMRRNLARQNLASLRPSNTDVTAIKESNSTAGGTAPAVAAEGRSREKTLSVPRRNVDIRLEPDPSSDGISSISGSVDTSSAVAGTAVTRRKPRRPHGVISRKEMKIFASLSCVVIAYLLCWMPWHVVFDIEYFDPSLVSDEWYTFASWMCYMNSAINPILYACANRDFRRAFRRILTCGWRKSPTYKVRPKQ